MKDNKFPFFAIYLFGSHAKNHASRWSDIDVAVITDRLNRDNDTARFDLRKYRRAVDVRIEPHGFNVKDFAVAADPLVHEIKKTGIRIV
ncbi:MAG: nucleotidyltransferase domain-containing protein [Patescibacteria group bacterium]